MQFTVSRQRCTALAVRRSGWIMVVLVFVGCSRGPARVDVPEWDPEGLAEEALDSLDGNNDGQLATSELEGAPGLRAAVATIDVNRDGKLSGQEIVDRIKAYETANTGLTPYECFVRYRGRPLQGARVRLVPEPFLADLIEPAEATANERGECRGFQIEGQPLPGVRMGMYRVEITSEQMQIPEQYNASSQLGVEVAPALSGRGSKPPDVFDVS